MPHKNPLTSSLGTIRETALGAARDPKGAAGKALSQVKGAAGLGRSVVEGVLAQVSARVNRGARRDDASGPAAESGARPTTVRAVPEEQPPRPHGDAVTTSAASPAAGKGPAAKTGRKKAAAKKASTKKAPSQKAASEKAASEKAAVAEPALGSAAQDEVVYTTETTGDPAAPGDPSPPPDGEGLIDPGTAKQIAKEAERGLRDAEPS